MIPGKHEQLGIADKTRRQPITTTLGKLYVVAVVLHDAAKRLQVLLLVYHVQQRGIIFINDDYHLRARKPASPGLLGGGWHLPGASCIPR